MARIKYDVSDVEAGGGGEQPQPNMYKGKIVSVTHRDKNRNGDPVNDLEIVVDVGAEYARMWTYVPASGDAPNAWKLRELLDAVNLPPKGEFDPKKLEGKAVNVKVAADTDLNGNYRGKVKNLLKPGTADQNGASGDDTTEYAEWDDDDIKAEIEERGLKVSGRWSRNKAIDLLIEDDGGEETAADEGEAAPVDEYDEWSLDDLKGEAEERGILDDISGRKTKEKLIEALREYDGPGAGDTDEEDATGTEDDYDDWELDELKEEVKDRKLEVKGRASKEKLIEALRKDDGDEPF